MLKNFVVLNSLQRQLNCRLSYTNIKEIKYLLSTTTTTTSNTSNTNTVNNRYEGYINRFNDRKSYAAIIRNDLPEIEYRFDSKIDYRDVFIRPFQEVAFNLNGSDRGSVPYNVTSIHGDSLQYMHIHSNSLIPKSSKNIFLSSTPNWDTKRHQGIVKEFFPERGYGVICPDELHCKSLFFYAHQLQTTGKERIAKGSIVEFFVQQKVINNQIQERAVCITRPNNGLITSEHAENGMLRRRLGALYTEKDTKAHIPDEYAVSSQRRQGYITIYHSHKLYGFILPFDNPMEEIFVHIDDCHIFGKRALKRFQPVEFTKFESDNHTIKAVHVCGPNGTVLRFNTENHYVPQHLCTKLLPFSDSKRYTGEIIAMSKTRSWFLIKPTEYGYSNVLGYQENSNVLDGKLEIGDLVEFSLSENQEIKKISGQKINIQRALKITAVDGRQFFVPSLETPNSYNTYLRTKFTSNELQLLDCPLTGKNQVINGWISTVSSLNEIGLIEPEAPVGKRYSRIYFEWKNCVKRGNPILQRDREVSFEIRPLSEERRRLISRTDKKLSTITQEAINVTCKNNSTKFQQTKT